MFVPRGHCVPSRGTSIRVRVSSELTSVRFAFAHHWILLWCSGDDATEIKLLEWLLAVDQVQPHSSQGRVYQAQAKIKSSPVLRMAASLYGMLSQLRWCSVCTATQMWRTVLCGTKARLARPHALTILLST